MRKGFSSVEDRSIEELIQEQISITRVYLKPDGEVRRAFEEITNLIELFFKYLVKKYGSQHVSGPYKADVAAEEDGTEAYVRFATDDLR